jgi:hypothetical protein
MYKKTIDLMTNTTSTNQIKRIADGAVIPFDPANTDYQEYLAWLAEGNEPEEAE